jgi:hypothetical protein
MTSRWWWHLYTQKPLSTHSQPVATYLIRFRLDAAKKRFKSNTEALERAAAGGDTAILCNETKSGAQASYNVLAARRAYKRHLYTCRVCTAWHAGVGAYSLEQSDDHNSTRYTAAHRTPTPSHLLLQDQQGLMP